MANRAYDESALHADLRWWAAANYLTVGQIYLQDNPLLREPLLGRRHQAAAARPLGHQPRPVDDLRAAQPADPADRHRLPLRHRPGPRRPGPGGQRLPGRHLQRDLSRRSPTDLGRAATAGPPVLHARRASPATSACRRPAASTRAASSATRWCTPAGRPSTTRTCSWPASSATARPRPGRSRRRGGCRPSSTPRRDGAVLPILHLNGYKISGPTVLGPRRRRRRRGLPAQPGLGSGRGLRRRPGDGLHRRCTPRWRDAHERIQRDPGRRPAQRRRLDRRPPLAGDRAADPQGLDRPGRRRRRAGRGHLPRPPGAAVGRPARTRSTWRDARGVAALLPARRTLFDDDGRLVAGAARARARRATCGCRRRRTPTAGGCSRPLPIPALDALRARDPRARRRSTHETTTPARRAAARRVRRDDRPPTAAAPSGCSARTRRPATGSPRCSRSTDRCLQATGPADRRPPLARRPGHGGALRAPLRGLARGLPAHRPARAVRDLRGVRDGHRRRWLVQHAKWLQHAPELPWRAPVPSLNVLLTSTCWRNDHNGFSHQGPGLIDTAAPAVARRRAGLAAAGRQQHARRSPTTACAAATTST